MSIPLWVKTIVIWASVLCAIISAYYWFKASTAVVSDESSGHEPGVEMKYTDKRTGKEVYVVATAMEQSRLNKIAALFTGLAVLLQAAASVLP